MQKKQPAKNPPGYDLSKPVKYALPSTLTEISGLAFYKGDSKWVYAQEDETGRVYTFDLKDIHLLDTKFAGKGDYEDIAITREQVVMLRSDGTLFVFPFAQLRNREASAVKTFVKLLPKGEYEGMHADEKTGLLYVLCKNCKADKKDKATSGYIFKLLSGGNVQQAGEFSVRVDTGKKKGRFMPSALAKNPRTGEWYILSSVNKLLVVADVNWQVKDTYSLNSSLFPQPEGIAFDKQNNLYISNEGGSGSGTILKFIFKK
ncbi:SdiA-regulated domain-containing protein [Mucilaginibacter limnophilus]|nr:SdiA-regulated domain-containing protein [Mucilaginibacter limnophilus]